MCRIITNSMIERQGTERQGTVLQRQGTVLCLAEPSTVLFHGGVFLVFELLEKEKGLC